MGNVLFGCGWLPFVPAAAWCDSAVWDQSVLSLWTLLDTQKASPGGPRCPVASKTFFFVGFLQALPPLTLPSSQTSKLGNFERKKKKNPKTI